MLGKNYKIGESYIHSQYGEVKAIAVTSDSSGAKAAIIETKRHHFDKVQFAALQEIENIKFDIAIAIDNKSIEVAMYKEVEQMISFNRGLSREALTTAIKENLDGFFSNVLKKHTVIGLVI